MRDLDYARCYHTPVKPLARLDNGTLVVELHERFSFCVPRAVSTDFRSVEEDGWRVRCTEVSIEPYGGAAKDDTAPCNVVLLNVTIYTTLERAKGKDMGEVGYRVVMNYLLNQLEARRNE